MKHLIYVILFSLVIVSCEKDTTENTIKPSIVNYPYDSIHKKLIGNWCEIIPNHNGVLDTYYLYRITYDSIICSINPNSCGTCNTDDLKPTTEIKKYIFISADTIKGEYYDTDSKQFFPHRTPIKFITKDKFVLIRYKSTNLNIVGMDIRDVTLVRYP